MVQKRLGTSTLFVMLCVFLFSLEHLGIQTSDDATMLATAGALWDDHSLAIPGMEWLSERVGIGVTGKDGQLVAKYGLGQAVTAAALYGVGETLLPQSDPYMWAGYPIVKSTAGATLALFSDVLLGCLLVGLVVYEIETIYGRKAAIRAGLMLMLASPIWLSARGFGAEIGTALGIVFAVMLARRALKSEGSIPLWVSVVGLGIAAFYRPSALAFGLAWVVWVWPRPRRDWITVGVALAIVAATIPMYDWIRYGSVFESGYGEFGSGFSLQVIGLAGYLFAPGRGLIVFAPWVLLIIPSAIKLLRRQFDWDAGVAAGIIGFYVFHSMWREWEGGWSFGPRLLIPILPAAAIVIAPFFAKSPRWTILLFLLGSLAQISAVAVDPTITHLNAISGEGIPFEEQVTRFRQTVWSLDRNIVVLQLKAVATPVYFVWLWLWGVMSLAWIGYMASWSTTDDIPPAAVSPQTH